MPEKKTLDQLRLEKERAELRLAQEQHRLTRLENRKQYYEKGERASAPMSFATSVARPDGIEGHRQSRYRCPSIYDIAKTIVAGFTSTMACHMVV